MALDGSRAWTRPLVPASVRYFKKAAASGAVGSGQPKASASGPRKRRVGNAERLPVGKNCRPRRDAKNANADRMVALHAQIYFTAWVACAREMKAPTFLVAIDRCRE